MALTLSDGKILLRPYAKSDAFSLYEAATECRTDDKLIWTPWIHEDYALVDSGLWIAECNRMWTEGQEYNFAVADAGTGNFLGGAGINRIDKILNYGNLGYWVRKSERERGVATAAARLAARFGLSELGLHRLEIIVATDNTASLRVAEKSGATREGILRNRLSKSGKPCDAVMHSFIKDDLDKL